MSNSTPLVPLKGVRVLVVEDHPDLQELMRAMLESAGAAVDVCGSGSEAVGRATGQVFDVILMDVWMPRGDGYYATRQLRSQGYASPIVAWTAAATPADRQRCLAAGFDGFLAKPTRFADMLAVMRIFTMT